MTKITVILCLLVGGCGDDGDGFPDASVTDGGTSTLIRDENARPGDRGWALDDFYAGGAEFQLYARPLSAEAGARIDVQVSNASASTITWAVYRLGHYGGTGGRKVAEGGPLPVGPQPAPSIDPATGLIECRWSSTLSFTIGNHWISGVYVARVALPDGSARAAPFIVRDDRAADVVVVLPTATDEAYNTWDGESLYIDTRFGFPAGHGYAVSFDRPLDLGQGGGIFLHSAMPTVRYLEANAYDVAYLADHDVQRTPSPLDRARAVLVPAHSEYWSKAMRDRYEAARDRGASLGFLGANIGFWQVRFEPAPDGMPDRRMIGYKEAADLDPVQGPENTGAFMGRLIDRPENELLGIMTVAWHVIDFPLVVRKPDHWILKGLGAKEGDLLPGLIGIESDGLVDNGRAPAGVVAVADSLAIGGDEAGLNPSHVTVYETASGSAVFSAGSIRFAARLSGRQAQVGAQRIVRNLLEHARALPALPEDTIGAASGFKPADFSKAARQVTTIAGKATVPGFADGAGSAARFDSPMGIALQSDGALIVADTHNHRIRRVAPAPDFTVSTLAGSGTAGDDDGTADAASFRSPFGVAASDDGTLYVSDYHGRRIRKIAAGVVSTLAGPSGLSGPTGIALAPDGTLWVADPLVRSIVRVSTSDGTLTPVTLPASSGGLGWPSGLLADGPDIWLLDSGRRTLRRLAGETVTLLAGDSESGFSDGDGRSARMAPFLGVAKVGANLWFSDTGNYRLRLVEPGEDASSTVVRTAAGTSTLSFKDGPGDQAGLVAPTGLAYDPGRNLVYVSDTGNSVIRAVTP